MSSNVMLQVGGAMLHRSTFRYQQLFFVNGLLLSPFLFFGFLDDA